jgi:catechol 2,3-dioxygenase
MNSTPIHPSTTVGPVHLTIANLERSLDFYQQIIGLRVQQRSESSARLGVGGPDLLILTEDASATYLPTAPGLYHFAILVPSRIALARSLRRIVETRTAVQGFSDHLVSEAIYLGDPDGLGIEIYRDRPAAEVPMTNGTLQMGNAPLDLNGLLAELAGHDEEWGGLAPQTTIGHIHLQVADIPASKAFYCDVLGFELSPVVDKRRPFPGALFISAGGYHHHFGLNTWHSAGAAPAPAGAIGLRYAGVQLPDQAALDQVVERLRQASVAIEPGERGLLVRDPAQNGIMLTVRTAL